MTIDELIYKSLLKPNDRVLLKEFDNGSEVIPEQYATVLSVAHLANDSTSLKIKIDTPEFTQDDCIREIGVDQVKYRCMDDIPAMKPYPLDSVQCDECGGHGCTICGFRGWFTPKTHEHGRKCHNERCGNKIPPAHIAVYCSNECAYKCALGDNL